jgi:DMSO/TMAO reductase YedYZ molybdopterin-dependent catalytic subunit
MHRPPDTPAVVRLLERRAFIKTAAAGTVIAAIGGSIYRVASDDLTRAAEAETRHGGRPRLPPGQKVLEELRPMGGEPGSARLEDFSLKVHGEVDAPFDLTWDALVRAPSRKVVADVHCVTGWSMLGGTWTGVPLEDLADRARVRSSARHVIFEAAHGYTANVPLGEALAPNVHIVWELNGRKFPRKHGAPVRGLVPDLYFWKSAKWLTGIRFVARDTPGYWETRGYHNHADPWREERYG